MGNFWRNNHNRGSNLSFNFKIIYMSNKSDKTGLIIQTSVTAVIVIVFTLFAFVIPQECDIDKVYLWCRVHPLTALDIVGLILFYGAAAMLAGIPKWFGFELGSPTGSSSLNLITFGVGVLGAILIWV